MVIAVDFDGTLCENAWPDIGEPKLPIIHAVQDAQYRGDKLILWTNREGAALNDALEWCGRYGLKFDAVNANLPELMEQYGNDPRKIGADIYIDDKAARPQDIEDKRHETGAWTDYGDGVYCCSSCGMPSGWGHPSLNVQILDRYCGSCGARMKNEAVGNRTPRETIRADWIQKERGRHQYYCSVCGGKQSYPSVWCSRCGTHMDANAWEKRWSVIQAWKNEPFGLEIYRSKEEHEDA